MGGEVPGGSLKGDPSTGLTGGESTNGFWFDRSDAGVVGLEFPSLPAAAAYGGGAVAFDADLFTPPAAPPAAPPAIT